ncbi:response regulator transcription factor [Marinobacter caseinilyticus]|uniref:response regulator transcription factor n=1 Tax=Marinobacter caseinilyticus TaxID=2692195 RepID=UPI00140B5E40|nr:response regulator transcription factor [Marinobacter caseinilyticus]
MTAKIVIVDDHPVFREGLVALINQDVRFEVVGETAGAKEALKLVRSLAPDAVIVDLTLAEGSGLQLIKSLRHEGCRAKLLVVSMHDDMVFAERALRAGANGYINKEQAADKVLTALSEVLNGDVYLDKSVSAYILNRQFSTNGHDDRPEDVLSDRELEVFGFLGHGLSSREIADKLYLSYKTIDSHREHIKSKLGLRNNAKLIQRAVEWAMLSDSPRKNDR